MEQLFSQRNFCQSVQYCMKMQFRIEFVEMDSVIRLKLTSGCHQKKKVCILTMYDICNIQRGCEVEMDTAYRNRDQVYNLNNVPTRLPSLNINADAIRVWRSARQLHVYALIIGKLRDTFSVIANDIGILAPAIAAADQVTRKSDLRIPSTTSTW